MPKRPLRIAALAVLAAFWLSACALLPLQEPPGVTVSGLEPLPGQGMELRMLLKLRLQNPNDTPIDYIGTAVTLKMGGKTFAQGVSDATGRVPRFGEALVSIPVTVSALSVLRQLTGVLDGQPLERIPYELRGRFARSGAADIRFGSKGELDLPQFAP